MKRKGLFIPVVIGILALVSCLTVIVVLPHTRMVLDDFVYAADVHHVWLDTHSIGNVLRATVDRVIEIYRVHQGAFIASFPHTLNGTTFHERYYWIELLIHFLLFVWAVFRMGTVLFRRLLKMEVKDTITIIFALLAVFINFVPDSTDAFFAYNLCSMYTGFYSLFLIAVSYVVELLTLENGKRKSRGLAIKGCLFAFLSGGGHLSVSAIISVFLIFALIYAFKWRRDRFVSTLIISIFGIASSLINALAPGYRMRAEEGSVDYGMSPLKSIFYSGVHALEEINAFTTIYFIAMIFLVAVLVLKALSKHGGTYKFSHPLFVTVTLAIVSIFLYVPNYYAIGSVHYLRLKDASFFQYYWVMIGLLIYWLGYFSQKYMDDITRAVHYLENISLIKKNCFALIVIAASVLSTGKLDSVLSINLARRMINGEIPTYSKERDEWIETCLEHVGEDVTVNDLSNYPEAIDRWHVGLTPGEYNWVNGTIADYYRLNSFQVIYD